MTVEAVVEQTQTVPAPSTGGEVSPEPTQQAEQQTETQATSKVEESKPRDGGFQRRIDRLTREKYQLEAALRAEREARERSIPQEQPKGEPKRDQFESYEDFLAAKAEFAAEAAADRRLAKAQENSRRQTEVERASKLAETWQAKQEKARDEFEDYDDVVSSSSAPVTAAMRDSIMGSDIGPALLRHLAMHPEDAERISKLSATSQARELGKIEAALLAPKPKPKAPETKPIEPVGQGGSASEGPNDKQSIKDWMDARNKQLRARRGF